MSMRTDIIIRAMRIAFLPAVIGLAISAESAEAKLGSSRAANFFVSPHGKDTWSGKQNEPGADDGPFATVARAQAAVRELLKAQPKRQPLSVVLRGGIYY